MLLRGLAVFLAIGLTLYALIDCARTPQREMQGLPKGIWLLVILLIPLFGPLAWILTGRSRTTPGPARSRGPVAPDDDPEFLRRLEAQKRQKAEDERLRKWEEELRRREQEGNGSDPGGNGREPGADTDDADRRG